MRLKRRFRNFGADSLAEHEILELLLFYAIPRGDVNVLAHKLLEHFGTLYRLFNAPLEALTAVPGVGESTAILIKLIPQLRRRYDLSHEEYLTAPKVASEAGRVLLPYFSGCETEVVYIMTLTNNGQMIKCSKAFEGTINKTYIFTRRIVETALNDRAAGIVLAHNHPSGYAIPSDGDLLATKAIKTALATVGVELYDHIIVAGDDWTSMASISAL
jgi:DNA repair protein RadC